MRANASLHATALFAGLLVACGQPVQQPPDQTVTITNPDNVVHTQGNSNPVATIQGFVSDAADGSPMESVTVTMLVNGQAKSATSSGGVYAMTQVPAGGTYRLLFSKNGYVKRAAMVDVPNTAGNFPQGNVVVEHDELMYLATSSVGGTVMDYRGTAAGGVKVVADLRELGFDLVQSVISSPDGTYRLNGLPGTPAGFELTVAAMPVDLDGDQVPDLGGVTAKALTFPGLVTTLNLRMRIGAGAQGELLTNNSFEDSSGGCTLTGWTSGTTSTINAPSATMTQKSEGACSARLGGDPPGGTTYLSGYSYLYQDVPIPDGVTKLTFSAKYNPDTNYAYTGHDRQACELRNAAGTTILSTMFSAFSNAMTWTPVTYDITGVANQTVRVYCYVYGDGSHYTGMYLDEVSLQITQ